MLATFEILIGLALLLITIVGFWSPFSGKLLNVWLLKHGVAEAMFPLSITATFFISA